MRRSVGWITFMAVVGIAIAGSPAQAQVYSQPIKLSLEKTTAQIAEIAVDQTGINFFWRVGSDQEYFFRRTVDRGVTFTADPLSVFVENPAAYLCEMSSVNRPCPKPDHLFVDGQGGIHIIAYRSSPDPWGLLLASSQNDGSSFSPPVVLNQDTDYDVLEAQVAVDASGVINIALTKQNNITYKAEIVFMRSTPGGNSFVEPISLSTGPFPSEVQIAVDGVGNVYVVWTEDDQVVLRRLVPSENGIVPGARVVLSGGNDYAFEPRIAVDGPGNVNVVWHEHYSVSGSVGSRIMFSRSQDGGATFSQPAVLTGSFDARTPQLAISPSGAIYVIWDDVSGAGRAVSLVRSVDGGTTFSEPVEVLQSGTAKGTLPAPPQLVVDATGGIHVAWSTLDSAGGWTVNVARARGYDMNFAEPQRLLAGEQPSSITPDPALVADLEGNVYVVWREVDAVFFATFLAGSTPVGEDVTVQPVDPTTGTAPVTVTFDGVTTPGETTVVTSSQGPPAAGVFKLGTPPVYYEISTTATVTFPATVCINYSGVTFNHEDNLNLGHWTGAGWEVLEPTSLDTDNDVICGQVSSLSPFAVLERSYVFGGFLPPVRTDGSAVFKSGRTIPLKFQLTDPDGALIGDAVATLLVFKISNDVEGNIPVEVESAGSSNSGTLFRYDAPSGQYIYNLNTGGYHGTFLIRVALNGGFADEVQISVR